MEASNKDLISRPVLESVTDREVLAGKKGSGFGIITAEELERRDVSPPKWIIEDLLPPGVFLLVAPPKAGKTRLATGIAVGLATGGKVLGSIEVEKCDVLCLFLEDSEWRIRERLEMILEGQSFPANLHLVTDWPTMDLNGLARLEDWLKRHPLVKLVIIDVLRKFCKSGNAKNIYQEEFDAIGKIKALADKLKIAIILIHHTNKLKEKDRGDIFDMVSGSTGLTGAVDTVAVLKRPNRAEARAKLHIAGRDVEAKDLPLNYDSEVGTWQIVDDPAEQCATDQRREIVKYLSQQCTPKQSNEIAARLGKNPSTVRGLLAKLVRNGQLIQPKRGLYSIPSTPQRIRIDRESAAIHDLIL